MNKFMQLFMLSCQKASELIDKKSVITLSIGEKMQLQMHTTMCDACKLYQKQSQILDNFLIQKICHHTPENVPVIENMELQNKIISKL